METTITVLILIWAISSMINIAFFTTKEFKEAFDEWLNEELLKANHDFAYAIVMYTPLLNTYVAIKIAILWGPSLWRTFWFDTLIHARMRRIKRLRYKEWKTRVRMMQETAKLRALIDATEKKYSRP